MLRLGSIFLVDEIHCSVKNEQYFYRKQEKIKPKKAQLNAQLNQPTGLKCWKCHARSFEECERRGYEQRCSFSQQSCELEIRER